MSKESIEVLELIKEMRESKAKDLLQKLGGKKCD